MTAVASSPSARSARLGLRATPEQEVVLRRAAEVARKSLTDFILDSACLAAEQTLHRSSPSKRRRTIVRCTTDASRPQQV